MALLRGVNRPRASIAHGGNTISHVLGDFSSREKLNLDEIFKEIIESIEKWDTINNEIIISQLNTFSNSRKDEI